MQIGRLIDEGVKQLAGCNITEAESDVYLLLGSCLGMSRTQLLLHADKIADQQAVAAFRRLLRRRMSREPVAYILQEKEFWSLPLFVNSNVLIPRPETEFLVECALDAIRQGAADLGRCLDLCCGSGAIAIALARELGVPVDAVDCSAAALKVAQKNVQRHRVVELVTLIASDMFSAINPATGYSLIISNPPYVTSGTLTGGVLQPEVTHFEPSLALNGGKDGLTCIREISRRLLEFIAPAGLFVMEFGADQGAEIMEIFKNLKSGDRYIENVSVIKDYSNRDRVLLARVNNWIEK